MGLVGKELQSFMGHAYQSVGFSPDGKIILTGSCDNTTKLWDTHSGEELATLIAIDSTDWVVTTPPASSTLLRFPKPHALRARARKSSNSTN
ncbi:MAG: hypothetical protein IPH31_14465 [Lewinellaceae bacterium]|nr:hypothetical protein [Lewinellaceae bacterium]